MTGDKDGQHKYISPNEQGYIAGLPEKVPAERCNPTIGRTKNGTVNWANRHGINLRVPYGILKKHWLNMLKKNDKKVIEEMALKRDKFDDVFSQLVRGERTGHAITADDHFHHEKKDKTPLLPLQIPTAQSHQIPSYNAFAHCLGCHRKLEDPYTDSPRMRGDVYGR